MKNKVQIQGIFFDLGGVIVKIDVYFKALSEKKEVRLLRVSTKALRRAFNVEDGRLEKDEETPVEFWRRIAKRLKVPPLNDKAAKTLLSNTFKKHGLIKRKTLVIARRLLREGYTVGIISNIINDHAAVIKKWKLLEYFNPVLLSNEVHVRKPERKMFMLASRRMGIPPEQLLFIDDNPKWLRAARSVGFKTILFKSTAQLRKQLKSLKILD